MLTESDFQVFFVEYRGIPLFLYIKILSQINYSSSDVPVQRGFVLIIDELAANQRFLHPKNS